MTPIRELMPRIKEMIIVGNRIYERCGICGKLVQVNKFLLGSFHLCLSDEDIAEEEPEWPDNGMATAPGYGRLRHPSSTQDAGGPVDLMLESHLARSHSHPLHRPHLALGVGATAPRLH